MKIKELISLSLHTRRAYKILALVLTLTCAFIVSCAGRLAGYGAEWEYAHGDGSYRCTETEGVLSGDNCIRGGKLSEEAAEAITGVVDSKEARRTVAIETEGGD